MRRLTWLPLAALVFAALPALAQGILPPSVSGWTSPSSTANPGPMDNAQSSAFREYGYVSGETQSYVRANDRIDMAVYKFRDPSGAYGAYSFLRQPDMAKADLTEHSSASSDRALALAGDLVLDIHADNIADRERQLKSLVSAVAQHAQDGLLPSLWEHLPQDNIVPRSDRYILGPQTLNQLFPGNLGDSLGFQNGAEAEVAHYRLNGQNAELLIADFPTPQLAQQQLALLQKKFNVNGSNPGAGSPLYAKRTITLLAIVAGAPSQADAGNLLSAIHSGTELTWNEPTFQFNEPRIEVMIVGSIIGSGIICLFAVIAGISFGGLRLIVKRVMPGKVFDRSEYVQILQLGLGSKPINSEDFYGYSAAPTEKVLVDKNLPDRVALRIFR
ncbi:MAG TPA: DUF6599 family protein [Candidatus Acidoferrales bacterium]|nr:DUF6599 family protein [Candidatus Acidoferrales bacterium]